MRDIEILANTLDQDRHLTDAEIQLLISRLKPFCCQEKTMNIAINILVQELNKNHGKNITVDKSAIGAITDEDDIETMIGYFMFMTIRNYDRIYSLGDSLDKYNFVWNNMVRNDIDVPEIISVPFSGSMYNNLVDQYGEIKLDPDIEKEMYNKFNTMLENNRPFADMCKSIRNGDRVLITDFGHSGKALLTIVKLCKHFGIDLHNTDYLQITPTIDGRQIVRENLEIHLNNELYGLTVYYWDRTLDPYFINSEHSKSRCVSKYSVDMWLDVPDDVWYNGLQPNYFQCNLSRFYLIAFLCCWVSKFVTTTHNYVLEILPNNNIKVLKVTHLEPYFPTEGTV